MKKLFFLTLITTLSTSFIFACSIMPSKCYELYPNRDTHEFRTCVDNERMQQIQIRRASLEKKLKEHEQEYNEIKNKLYVYTSNLFIASSTDFVRISKNKYQVSGCGGEYYAYYLKKPLVYFLISFIFLMFCGGWVFLLRKMNYLPAEAGSMGCA